MKILDLPPALTAIVPGNYPDLAPLAATLDETETTIDAAVAFNNFLGLQCPAGYDNMTSHLGKAIKIGRLNCISKSYTAAIAATRFEAYGIIGCTKATGDLTKPDSATNARTFHAYNLLTGPDAMRVRQDYTNHAEDVKTIDVDQYGQVWQKVEAQMPGAATHDGVIQVRRKDAADTLLLDRETQRPIQEGEEEIDTFFVGLNGLLSFYKLYNYCYAAKNNRKPKRMPQIVLPRT